VPNDSLANPSAGIEELFGEAPKRAREAPAHGGQAVRSPESPRALEAQLDRLAVLLVCAGRIDWHPSISVVRLD
jgi:hypothetical protein